MDDLVSGVLSGSRAALARAVTLVESRRRDHQILAEKVIQAVVGRSASALRLGVSGVPGVGKSTFINALGQTILDEGLSIAVLAVDPSSPTTGGSLLADKTRMGALVNHPRAFVRPSPSGGMLGGVAGKTQESMLLFEAAGFDVVIVETVGVGQSETAVEAMVDVLLLLVLPRSGDELQGIKRGILESVDAVSVHKADGALLGPAEQTRDHYRTALQILRGHSPESPKVFLSSAQSGAGVHQIWKWAWSSVREREASKDLQKRRSRRAVEWMWRLVHEQLVADFEEDPHVRAHRHAVEEAVRHKKLTPAAGARRLLRTKKC